MRARRIAALLVTSTLTLVAAACGDSGDEGSDVVATTGSTVEESSTTTDVGPDDTTRGGSGDDGSTTAEDTTAESTAPESTGALVGDWTADVGEVLAILTAPFGGAPVSCSGPYVISFGEDGSFQAALEPVCVVGDIEATGVLGSTGRYTDDGTTFQVIDNVGEGTMSIGGVVTPLPIVDGLAEAFGLPAQYTIVGDVLEFSFTSPDGADYTLQFQRAA